MTPRAGTWIDPVIVDYCARHTQAADNHQQALAEETTALGRAASMQIGVDQGALLELLVRATGARRIVEVGTFTGHSALCMARGLPDDGYLLCCDVSEEWTAIARRAWHTAGVAAKIELRLGPAADTLAALPVEEQFDLAFIDADKPAYQTYLELILPRLRRDGLLIIDNTLWDGRVLDETVTDQDTVAIRAFNDAAAADPRLQSVMLPIADGVTLLRKR
ncbi:MAG TPA: class I SAM-dependent methyltransferase [Acidimicrobiales bacterium]